MAIPVTVIGGYLGSGKTTLVNHLLRNAAGLRLAVLVNEFGALPIDADLIEGRDGDVLAIAGGCICCSYGSDLMEALYAIARRTPAPDQVLIEASGVALPGAVVSAVSLIADYENDATIVLADAETVRRHAGDRFLADTITRQLADADLVLLNKSDLVARDVLSATEAWLAEKSGQARTIVTERSRAPLDLLLGHGLGRQVIPGLQRPGHGEARYETHVIAAGAPLDLVALGQRLADPSLGILRAKGFLANAEGGLSAFQLVGQRANITRRVAKSEHRDRLVVIGLSGALDLHAIESAIAACSGGH